MGSRQEGITKAGSQGRQQPGGEQLRAAAAGAAGQEHWVQLKGRQRGRGGSGNKDDAEGDTNWSEQQLNSFQVAAHTRRLPCAHLFGGGKGGAAARAKGAAAAARARERRRFNLEEGHNHTAAGGAARAHERGCRRPKWEGPRAQGVAIATGARRHQEEGCRNPTAGALIHPNLKQTLLHTPARKTSRMGGRLQGSAMLTGSNAGRGHCLGRAGRDVCGGDGEKVCGRG